MCVRRNQAVVDAYSDPDRIDFTKAKRSRGVGSLEEAIDPKMNAYVAKSGKDEAEVDNARDCARPLKPSRPTAHGKRAFDSLGLVKPKNKSRQQMTASSQDGTSDG